MLALVTGGTGFVGYHVVAALRERGHQVRALVRDPERAQALIALGADICVGDLATGAGIEAAVRGSDAVFHVAAHYSLDRRDDAVMYAANVEGTRRLIDAVRRAGGPRLVYTSSTAAVKLRHDGKPATEEDGFNDPDKVYSTYKKTKVLAERLAMDAAASGMDIVIVNPSTPVGPYDVKPTPTGRIVLDTMLGRMPAYVETGLNLVAVEDVALGHLLAYERGRRGERYILGHRNMHFGDLVAMVARLSGRRAPRAKIPFWVAMSVAVVDDYMLSRLLRRAPRAPVAGVKLAREPMYFDATKAVQELGMPQSSVEDALRRAITWFREAGMAPVSK
ncbi:dihydroflavonol-4-reductase [Alicyclobacillus hesperidum]|uniref:Dihydroflavonol-4-reductase n=1 Tax=Alicyclobacillus hesperidum TaxID=89784 RepID=A0A1H2R476_9BACL|nr:hopanoid-associated sugar epimerase [Alicyclobacillus hesperidum]GLV13212.1 dihydroflavonol-4-reductase [Alicyclobacillus hesperidum]SDW13509.1 dihydroflavonol-4-reductase [Alicyclobacillus hesperidum]